jgi:uncharacterized glyoxalase superfamily protein PhnB
MKLGIYLNYGGNCEQAFRFYEQHLGGKITMLTRHGEQQAPSAVPAEWKDAILHARIAIGVTVLMGADIPPDRFQPMRPCCNGGRRLRAGPDEREGVRYFEGHALGGRQDTDRRQ